jgi:hypothetical protein
MIHSGCSSTFLRFLTPLVLLVGACILTGCHDEGPGELPGSTIHLKQNQVLELTGRGGQLSMPVDIDGDSAADLEFKLDAWSQMGGGGWSWASVNCINGAFGVNTYVTRDTAWQSDALSYRDGSYWGPKLGVIITRTFSCRQLTVKDSILRTRETIRMKNYPVSDRANPSGEWTSPEVYFYNFGYTNSFGLHEIKKNADTVWLIEYKDVVNCHLFPSDTTYISVRKSDGNEFKSGWVRLAVESRKITVLESEIQK